MLMKSYCVGLFLGSVPFHCSVLLFPCQYYAIFTTTTLKHFEVTQCHASCFVLFPKTRQLILFCVCTCASIYS